MMLPNDPITQGRLNEDSFLTAGGALTRCDDLGVPDRVKGVFGCLHCESELTLMVHPAGKVNRSNLIDRRRFLNPGTNGTIIHADRDVLLNDQMEAGGADVVIPEFVFN